LHKLEDIINFIEQKQGVKLYDYQKTMLKAMVEGKIFSSPRMYGRKIVLDGYYEYLKRFYDNQIPHEKAEIHITGEDVIKETKPFTMVFDEEAFKQEYECQWVKSE
jgi:hypothetical protein